MALKVLKQQVERPVGGDGNRPFPKGLWNFTILKPEDYGKERTRPTPGFMHNEPAEGQSPRVSGEAGSGVIYSLWLGEAAALAEGQDDAGDQKFFIDFVVEDDGIGIMNVDLDNPNGVGWQIQKDALLISKLALALGAVSEVTQGGEAYYELASNFVDLLEKGTFDGEHINVLIGHKAWTSKTDPEKKGTNVIVRDITAV